MVKVKDYFNKKVTHTSYIKKRKKNAFWAGYLPFEIHEPPMSKTLESVGKDSKKKYRVANHEVLVREEPKFIGPLIFGIFSTFMLFGSFFIEFEEKVSGIYFLIINTLILFSSVVYYFTVPDKELILNRRDGLVSFPAFAYGKPFTMAVEKLRIGYTSGASGSPGPGRLIIIRPTKKQFGFMTNLGGSYFEELSFLIWYMDKNRPLPPGNAFDEYRKADYKRRKEEGFPPPVFRSFIPTREYKHKWQKERDKHWKDIIETDEKGNQVHRIWQSAENVERHGEWKPVVPQ
ncbi:hypothetical protein SAMN05421766_10717 [Zobellia uliginosa]|uniref:PH domain-containing protein n=2 Tax=Zobellia uliginosa TaxID=143224 RepID=A0ABY1L470_9FLAO|nr:hypothetical protein SAMN05421766_10717 [Zobellia uliginosa]